MAAHWRSRLSFAHREGVREEAWNASDRTNPSDGHSAIAARSNTHRFSSLWVGREAHGHSVSEGGVP